LKIKKDKYLRERGKTTKIIRVLCAKCNSLIFIYQKDGPGWLKRCYLNRVFEPKNYAKIKDLSELSKLKCKCGSIIGSPIRYKDGRLAYHLVRGKFRRKTLGK
jgi:hypothetical protein